MILLTGLYSIQPSHWAICIDPTLNNDEIFGKKLNDYANNIRNHNFLFPCSYNLPNKHITSIN